MKDYDFQLAAQLAANPDVGPGECLPDGIRKLYGAEVSRLVTRLRRLPFWEARTPTPQIAEREWKKMVREAELRRKRREGRKLVRRLL